MRGLVFNKAVALRNDLPDPVRAPGESLIKVLMAGICQTDIEIIKGYMEFQGIPGHEFIGTIEDTDNQLLLGKRVAGEINCGCGICAYCQRGMSNHCPGRTVIGIAGRPGAFAEYLILPEKNLHIIPDTVPDEAAVFVEPLAACYRILEQVDILKEHSVAVLGDGRLGLLCAQVLKTTRCQVTLIGKHPEKLSMVTGMGITTLMIDAGKAGQYDIVVDCTGSAHGITSALQLIKPQGTVIVKTTTAEQRPFDLNSMVVHEVSILGSRCGPFARAISALQSNEVRVMQLISKVFPFNQAVEALQVASEKNVVKVLLRM